MVSNCVLIAMLSLGQVATAERTGRLIGRITVEGGGTPIAGAHVIVFSAPVPGGSMPSGRIPETFTDQDGRFALPGILPGTYGIDVQKPGFVPLNQAARSAVAVDIAAGQTTLLELHLQRGSVITGRVLDASGEPAVDVPVIAMQRQTSGQSTGRLFPAASSGAQTNDIGEFRLSGLAAGDYYVAAMPPGGSPVGGAGRTAPSRDARSATAATFFPGTTDQASATPVSVVAGAEVANVSFTMQSLPAFRVSGIAVDENGEPIANAMIMVIRDPREAGFPGVSPGTQSEADGRFTIGPLVAGTYHLSAAVPILVGTGRGGGAVTWSSSVTGGVAIGPPGGGRTASTEVVVTDADLSGVRVVARRPDRQ